jgi:hypothetical protein
VSELREYNPIQVVGSFAGVWGSVDILEGAVVGDFLNITRDRSLWERETDGFGNSVRVRHNNIGGRVVVQLSASSPTNDTLSKIVLSDVVAETNVGYLWLQDLNSDSRIIGTGAFIADFPQLTFGTNRGGRSWTFECAAIQILGVLGHYKA